MFVSHRMQVRVASEETHGPLVAAQVAQPSEVHRAVHVADQVDQHFEFLGLRLGRQPAGGINRLSHPRAVLETIYAGRHNGAIDIDIDLCRGRSLSRRAFGCLSARGIAGSRLH